MLCPNHRGPLRPLRKQCGHRSDCSFHKENLIRVYTVSAAWFGRITVSIISTTIVIISGSPIFRFLWLILVSIFTFFGFTIIFIFPGSSSYASSSSRDSAMSLSRIQELDSDDEQVKTDDGMDGMGLT